MSNEETKKEGLKHNPFAAILAKNCLNCDNRLKKKGWKKYCLKIGINSEDDFWCKFFQIKAVKK